MSRDTAPDLSGISAAICYHSDRSEIGIGLQIDRTATRALRAGARPFSRDTEANSVRISPEGFCASSQDSSPGESPVHIGRGVLMSEKHTGASQSGAHALTTTTRATARTMSSREIAELTEKNHADVLRDIRNMLEQLGLLASSFAGYYVAENGKQNPCFDLPEDLTITLVSGYSVQMRHRIVKRWQELEAAAPKPAELSRMEILRLAMESEEARIRAEAERDEAIRTKALIGSKREATAMATASAAKREAAQLRDALGVNSRHATVIAVQRATGTRHDWLPLRRWCKANGLEAVDVPDARYGTAKAWPAGAWSACHGVDLVELFGEVAA